MRSVDCAIKLLDRRATALEELARAQAESLRSSATRNDDSGEQSGASIPNKARTLLAREHYEEAFELLSGALANEPDNPGLLILKAEAFLGLHQLATARDAVLRVLAIFPQHTRARSLLRAIDSTPDIPASPAEIEASSPVEEASDFNGAMPSPQVQQNGSATQQEPAEDFTAIVDSALALLRGGNVQGALNALTASSPEEIPRDYFHTLALCYAKQGDLSKSLEAVSEELNLYPDNTSALALKQSLVDAM